MTKTNASSTARQTEKTGTERRDFDRIPIGGMALIRYHETDSAVLIGQIQDVSASGVCIKMHQPLREEVPLELLISVEDPEAQFFISGRSIWCRENTNDGNDFEYLVGIVLTTEQDQPDSVDWRALFLA